ncbi:hypothetical protein EBR96_03845 [bacterium]|nr:hypothetical protein [bacterium]
MPNYVHSFLPRYQSLRWRIAEAIHERPFDRIFAPGYPIAATTGIEQGRRIAKLLSRYFRDFPKHELHIYELLSGTGILGLHVMDALKESEFYLYQCIRWHITDPSAERVAHVKANPLMARHENRISIEQMSLGMAMDNPPDAVLIGMGLSQLPARHVVSEDSQLYEAVIRSRFDDDSTLFDSTSPTGTIRKSSDIRIDTDIDAVIPSASTVLRDMTEEWALVRASTANLWAQDELEGVAEGSDIPGI